MGTTTARPPMPPGPIAGPSAWYGRDLGRSDEWIRHLLRLWLCAPDGRPLPECYLQRYGRITVGDRGGILVRGAIPTVPLEPC